MNVLGVWDGHDAGAALVVDGVVVAAANEERFTRRKLDVGYPVQSILACCERAGVVPADIETVAFCTSDVAKTLGRLVPSTREAYYRVRRRKAPPGRLTAFTRLAKYRITEWGSNPLTRALSLRLLRRSLHPLGIRSDDVRLYDHHACHAIAAAEGSRFDRCAVLTIDGVGDGLSATVSRFADGVLTRMAATPARHSPGIFFEHVTNLLNMRELEDEGKVMALADYASPVADERNPLLALIQVSNLRFHLSVTGRALRSKLRDVLWYYPNEQFAAMAQRALETACVALAREAVARTGCTRVALSGGVASNVKANRLIRLLPEVDDVYVFPHMGDGGLALGAALLAARERATREPGNAQASECGDKEAGSAHASACAETEPGTASIWASDLALGPSYSDAEIRRCLDEQRLAYAHHAQIAGPVADLLCRDRIVLWFQGRMEYGPRALGHRSVLARPDRRGLRDRLNLVLKRRVWYQPFCPSILEADARRMFAEMKGTPNRHMTSAYMVASEHREALAGVINVDGSCRPQLLDDHDPGPFATLLREMRARIGVGALLNTSFNIHGEPLVCTPRQAVDVFRESGADALAIGSYLVLAASACDVTPLKSPDPETR